MSNLGMGVMLHMLGGNKETVDACQASFGKKIRELSVDGNELRFVLDDGSVLVLFDDGQSCCESRYMRTDDDLAPFIGATLTDAELRAAPATDRNDNDYGDHDVQFLIVNTSAGSFTVANHNEHNGYYGGFAICARLA